MLKRQVFIGDFVIGSEEKKAVLEVLDSQRISEGKKTKEFEKLFAKYIGTKYCVAVNSGTSALVAGLLALINDERYPRIKKGAKVITSPITYAATSNAIILAGLEPVYVDIYGDDYTLKIDEVEELLKNAKVLEEYCMILPVHLMGYANDMFVLNSIAKKYGLATFEDSSQAHGTVIEGKKAGACSLLSTFSFYIAHNIQAGEMGAIVTDDENIYKLIKQLKANGRMCSCPVCIRSKGRCPHKDKDFDPRFTHEYIGYNFKTMDIQAALAITQVKKADKIFKTRQENVKRLFKILKQFQNEIRLPVFNKYVSYLALPLLAKNGDRKTICNKLEEYGIETRPLFGCLPTQQPAFKRFKKKYEGKLPNAEYIGKNAFYIGCHQYLNDGDFDQIENSFTKIFGG